jgi:hypothetical protein
MSENAVLAVIPTRTNFFGLKKLLDHLHILGIPAKIYDNGHEDPEAQDFLSTRNDVVDANGWKFYRMWNNGWRYAAENGYDVVAFLNDDITLADKSLSEAANALLTHKEYGLVGLNWRRRVADGEECHAGVTPATGSYRVGGIGGWAFMVRANLWGVVPPIDEAYHIWYGDDELFCLMEQAGWKTGLAVGAPVDHEMSSTLDLFPELKAKTGFDQDRFVRRWGNR